jgi:aspartate/methionine/tyrosine aminotransferase
VLVVSPNNPTGTALSTDELTGLARLCRERGVALIGDEVFADYRFDGRSGPSVLQQEACLTFGLGGLSKTVGLPQLKLAWIGAAGPAGEVDTALARLELIADTYLSVATPVQVGLAALLDAGRAVRRAIQHRLRANLDWLRGRMAGHPACSLLEPDGGWSAVVRVPDTGDEEGFIATLLERHGVFVQPGYFYDFPHGAWVVLSLLVPEDRFRTGMDRLLLAIPQ